MELLHLRHTLRTKPNKHINQEGLSLAQQVGKQLGSFDLVLSSVSTRAVETCVAMGFAVDDHIDFSLADVDTDKPQIDLEDASYLEYFKSYSDETRIFDFGNNCRDLVLQKIKEKNIITEGRVLLVSHGGVIESSTIAFLPSADFSLFGKGAEHCNGVRITLNEKYDVNSVEPVRHKVKS